MSYTISARPGTNLIKKKYNWLMFIYVTVNRGKKIIIVYLYIVYL